MMFFTHLLFGILAGVAGCEFLKCDNQLLFVSISAVAALLPDIDHIHSRVGKKIPPIAILTNFLFGHRGLMHSVWIPAVLYIIIAPYSLMVASAVFIGIVSHVFLDATTPAGIRPLWPLKTKIKGPFKTNSFFEKFIMLFLFCIIAVLVSVRLLNILP